MTATRVRLTGLARAVLAISLLLLGFGVLFYGVSAETHQRMWSDIFARPDGPMTFRFVLQPVTAAIAATADGVRDAQLGRTPYIWAILTNSDERGSRLTEGVNATARILLLGFGMDALYQYRVFGAFYPAEALILTIALAFVPYALMRGPITRVARWWRRQARADQARRTGG
jgi:hypothetical protein